MMEDIWKQYKELLIENDRERIEAAIAEENTQPNSYSDIHPDYFNGWISVHKLKQKGKNYLKDEEIDAIIEGKLDMYNA